jgi:hypothetical protein
MTTGEYKTIIAGTTAELDKKVSEALRQGYKLYGSPYVVIQPTAQLKTALGFYQAVIGPPASV